MPVNPISINAAIGTGNISPIGSAKAGEVDFKDLLSESMDKLNSIIQDSNAAGEALATGSIDDIHSAMIAAEKADLALQFTIQIRNKIIDAYNEIMHMQI
ncbi:flagellar hook-basal body complex protein FliE [Mahella australiensis]|uniref:Flagellar hook-basal body complex protein FliE n=1 Tax=Mahella australiensis (strain DSM 15567 / CIP 107919 / 50-1 BON) TaxID=697281 RepID=F4A1L5_MAHA5|nr:flagellar hook-basal body complex protein FliE [Mahella australiensis]AEE96049.1 flagellar hook-basal body complex subunit FliE [Mahella australiensis 50-1 BON]